MIDAINHVYNPKQFSENKGGFFPKFKSNPEYYVVRCSDSLKAWLRRLKDGNKKLFIITSSYIDFAKSSLKFILG